ncbi:DUF3667 domain-containing protein [Luteimonas sp. MC1750]|uniref:DUF3667 domain-containing protein n=1 Tax=Luteimonas sp. MC1750 TaxID=2799326 RepID=UPI0018F0CFEC|nr:DUF3667 domain-containing protein [Luteimonas sp. MC1750]MBJ6984395.1 DUF3667 domain-containing protein [Luteimonas sp. MC1750]QQO04986.1 DUF3667 domain-containing protein [Luteimonas sp. MC1750]
MSKQAAGAVADDVPAQCENCAATLHGVFCHACGQSVHNPIRHLGHAVEEFFEAFWHLDGRLFRTLRDLWSPGKVAINYLAGHRARYIAPLRLFVVLSVLTFFIGAVVIHVEDGGVDPDAVADIANARTPAEVERVRDALVAGIEQARVDAGETPGVDPALVMAEVRVQSAAANRIRELEGKPAAAPVDDALPPSVRPARLQLNILGHRGEWHPQDNPFIVGWWPGFANDWLNRKLGNLEKNMQSLGAGTADSWLKAMMASAPSALFLLVPVFAVLLRIAYLFSGRVYLEHLVVALYSHVFLLIMLTLAFVLAAANSWVSSTLGSFALGACFAAVMAWMPIYLLLMQKRVYRQAWWLTLLKYLVVGYVYFMMLLVATLLVFLARLTAA